MQHEISFVVAAYNAEASVERAVRSALAQRDVSLEVIVIDDFSTDQTRETVLAIGDPRVRLIKLDRNGGPGVARNAGLDAATGRWIAVLDADDAVHPERTRRMIRRAEATGAEIVVDNLELSRPIQTNVEPMFEPSYLSDLREITLATFIAGNIPFRSTFNLGYLKPVILRDFLDRNALRYDPSLSIGEDYLFLASALAAGARCAVDPSPGYIYSISGSSISSVLELRHVKEMLSADEAFLRVHVLEGDAKAAQMRRTRGLEEAASFLLLVQHIKTRSVVKAGIEALRHPAAIRHLSMPISARFHRMVHRFAG